MTEISGNNKIIASSARHSYGALGMALSVGSGRNLSPAHCRAIFTLFEQAHRDHNTQGRDVHDWSIGEVRKKLNGKSKNYDYYWKLLDDIWEASITWNYINASGVQRRERQRILVTYDDSFKSVVNSTKFKFKVHEDIRNEVYNPERFLVLDDTIVSNLSDISYSIYRITRMALMPSIGIGKSIVTPEYPIEEIKNLLFIGSKYDAFKDLNRYVLAPAINGVNENPLTDIHIELQTIKERVGKGGQKKVTKVKFQVTKIRNSSTLHSHVMTLPELKQDASLSLYNRLVDRYKCTPSWVSKWVVTSGGESKPYLESIGEQTINEFLLDIERETKAGAERNIPAYINGALRKMHEKTKGGQASLFPKSESLTGKPKVVQAHRDVASLKEWVTTQAEAFLNALPENKLVLKELEKEFESVYSSQYMSLPKSVGEQMREQLYLEFLARKHLGDKLFETERKKIL